MPKLTGLLLGSVMSASLTAGLVPPARADDSSVVYVVTYIEVAPSAAAEARALLKAYGEASRREDGNLRFETLHRAERPNHFAIVEAWKTEQAQAAHTRTMHTKQFREGLQPFLSAAYDERPHVALSVGPSARSATAAAVYVVTHVDVIPTYKEPGARLVKELADTRRADPGNLRFDALTQSSRPNHMTLVHVWVDRKAFEGHVAAAAVRRFREALAPMSGSLYDERLYTRID